MFQIEPVPQYFQYDLNGICYFEVYPNGDVVEVSGDITSVGDKKPSSVYGSYQRSKNNECILYLATVSPYGDTKVYRVNDLEALADSYGIFRAFEHEHDIHAAFSENDKGSGRYAEIDIELRCGCVLGSHNKRIMAKYLKERYGWEIVLKSIDSEPLSKRRITVERKSLSNKPLPF